MQKDLIIEKKKYHKEYNYKINLFFNENGEEFEKTIEKIFGRYCMRSERLEVRSKKLW